MAPDQNRKLTEAVSRERARLRNFIRKRVPNESDAEDILQDVFYELIEADRLMKPVEQVGAWLYRVARNRITDLFRRKTPIAFPDGAIHVEDQDSSLLEELLPSPDEGPDAAYARTVLIQELEAALEELPDEQRVAFLAHEIEGRSFKEMANETGFTVNALILRKHYAVLYLRKRLEAIYDEFRGR